MRVLNLGTELREAIRTEGVQIVQFGAASCAPCTALEQKLAHWCRTHPAVDFLYVPLETCPAAAAQEGIFTTPAILVFVQGRMTLRESGYFSLEAILSRIERDLSLLAEADQEN